MDTKHFVHLEKFLSHYLLTGNKLHLSKWIVVYHPFAFLPNALHILSLQMEYFQDDLFPPTRDTSKPTMSATEWVNGDNYQHPFVKLRPSDMQPRK